MKPFKFTDKSIAALPALDVELSDDPDPKKPRKAEYAARYEVADLLLPPLICRVYPSGRKCYMLRTRFPGMKHSERRLLGDAAVMTVDDARGKARDWLALISKHEDPADVERRDSEAKEKLRNDEQRARSHTVAAVFEQFKVWPRHAILRTAAVMDRRLNNEIVSRWGDKPIGTIGEEMLASLFGDPEHHTSYWNNVYDDTASLFKFAARPLRAIPRSPFKDIDRKDYLPDRKRRKRALNDAEIVAYWRAAERLNSPWKELYTLLMLCPLRLLEAAHAEDGEYDDIVWTIPASRMKGSEAKAREFEVPMVPEIKKLLDGLPRYDSGPFLFSCSFGVSPVGGFGEAAKRHKQLMKEELAKLGVDEMEPWHLHDVRRSIRSKLGDLTIDFEIKEMLMAHVLPAMADTYDVGKYRVAKAAALNKWHAHLRGLLADGAKVVPFPRTKMTARARLAERISETDGERLVVRKPGT